MRKIDRHLLVRTRILIGRFLGYSELGATLCNRLAEILLALNVLLQSFASVFELFVM